DQRAEQWVNMDWDDAKSMFMHGVRQGMAVLNQKVESGAYDQEAQELAQEFGPDPQIEPIMFKLSNMYYQQTQGDPTVDMQDLRLKLEIYAEWLHTGNGFDPFAEENIVQQGGGRRHRQAMVIS